MKILKLVASIASVLWLALPGFAQESSKPAEKTAEVAAGPQAEKAEADSQKKIQWRPLLPEKGLEGWEVTDFGGQGEVKRQEDMLLLEMGDPLTGINYTKKDFPTNDFEIELEAQRIEGSDFLCGLTFPVGEGFCSLIAGGWGGGVVGLSNVDGYDASENSTSTYHSFENGQWYKFRVRVDDEYVRAWIDDKEFFRQDREGHEFSTRIEVYVCQPLGFCVFQSKVGLRNFRWRPLKPAAGAAASPAAKAEPKSSPLPRKKQLTEAAEPAAPSQPNN